QKLKMEGVKKGVPDLCLPVAKKPYNGLYIEMKRRTGGNVSVDQKKWLQRLNKAGYLAVVAHGCDEAWEVLMNYLNNGGLK
ncbi:MAG: VRR-NUC domain-containing protein, partial [Proteobacteria bacterium]|nr:VRR-NUC domain-containing protein [Pseudomonadota bacterium]